MANSRELMSASTLLTELSSVKDGDEIRLPLIVKFTRTTHEYYINLARQLIRAKSPKAVVLYKWYQWPDTSLIDEKSLAAVYEMLIDARVKTIKLELVDLSYHQMEELYQMTKRILSQTMARPLWIACARENRDYWALRFLKLINLPRMVEMPEDVVQARPVSTPPVSVTRHSIFSAATSVPDLSASAHAGSLHDGQPVYVDEPPPDFLIESPEKQPGGYCSIM